jgi:hypothetical protein
MIQKSVISMLMVTLISFLMAGTLSAQTLAIKKGSLIKSEQIAVFDKDRLSKITNEELQAFLNSTPMPFEEFKGKFATPQNGLTLYKLTYQTSIPELNNRPTVATGLIAIPDEMKKGAPMISYQHGTVFGKNEVPSHIESSMEMRLILAQFGSQGFVCIGADYIGLGDSKEPNSYFCRKATEEACMDMYTAANSFLKKKNMETGPFFTMGWSQGAYNNMLFLRRLEEAKIEVVASVTAAAPVDLNFFMTRGVSNPRPIDAVYTPAAFGNLLFAFENYYHLTGFCKSSIRPEQYNLAKDFYNHKLDFMDYMKKGTTKATEFVKPEFIEQLRAGNTKFSKILNESEAYRWLSKTPLRAYYGMLDEAVPPYLSHLAVDYQSLLGKTNGQAINAGEKADHRNTYVYALIDVLPWFKSYVK